MLIDRSCYRWFTGLISELKLALLNTGTAGLFCGLYLDYYNYGLWDNFIIARLILINIRFVQFVHFYQIFILSFGEYSEVSSNIMGPYSNDCNTV